MLPYATLAGDPEDSWTRSQLSLVLLSRRKASAADREAIGALFRDPEDTSAWYVLGESALAYDPDFVRQCVGEIRKRDPEYLGALDSFPNSNRLNNYMSYSGRIDAVLIQYCPRCREVEDRWRFGQRLSKWFAKLAETLRLRT